MGTEEPGEVGGKLREGVRVILYHPDWAASCKACLAFSRGVDGKFKYRPNGEPYRRPPGFPTPCRYCPKVPDYAKANTVSPDELRAAAHELSPENRKAYEAYKGFRATRTFPDDAIVRWYSAVIRDVEDAHARHLEDRRYEGVIVLTEFIKAKYGR